MATIRADAASSSAEPAPPGDLWTISRLDRRHELAGAELGTRASGTWLLVLQGKVELETAEEPTLLGPGDAVLVAARTAHRLTALEPVEVVVSDLQPVLVHQDLPTPLVVQGFSSRHPAVAQLVTSCSLSTACPTSAWSLSYAGLVGAALRASWSEEGHGSTEVDHDAVVARLLTHLSSEPGGDWTLVSMASSVHLSRSALVTRFRRATGRTPMQVLRDLRMHEARRLLCGGEASIGAVAHAVGYGSTAAFSRAFSSHHGVPPQSWRADAVSGARQPH